MEKNYLLQETEEAQEMCAKIKDLLTSAQSENITLALQLLQGGGVPHFLIPYVWSLAYSDFSFNRKQLEKILKSCLPDAQQEIYKTLKKSFKNIDDDGWDIEYEKWAERTLQILGENEATKQHFEAFCEAFLLVAGKGAKYLLKNKLLPEETIIRHLLRGGHYLSLSDFDLTEIPTYIGNFTQIEILNLTGNPFTDLPDSFENLKHVHTFYFDKKATIFEIEPTLRAKLERFFPEVMASAYNSMGWNAVEQNETEEGIKAFERATELQPTSHEYWNSLSWGYSHIHEYEKSFKASDRAVELAENDSERATYLSNKASDQQRSGFAELCMQTAQRAIDYLRKIPKKHWTEADHFSCGLALQIMGKFEQALKEYELHEQKSYRGSGGLYYNKACIYARLGDKENMKHMMELTIQEDSIDWVGEMRHDTDFQNFWNDSVIDELEQYQKEYRDREDFF
jgi:tetratricopeptide (TPR) repeat protein